MGKALRVLFVASEGVPFAKTGGLADVVGTLPKALQEQGAEVKVLMPYYGAVKQGKVATKVVAEDLEAPLPYPLNLAFDLHAASPPELPFYFVAREEFFDRGQLYGTPRGDYFDNLERFAFFSAAVLPVCQALDFQPHVIHCHDWQSALAVMYLKNRWQQEPILAGARSLLTIHNLAYQGLFPKYWYPMLGLDWSLFCIDGLEYYDQINLLKGGIICADAINTVSPTYSQEIQTPEFGYGLDGVLRREAAKLSGILNGVDYSEWSPETDPYIPARFSRKNLKGKAADKAALMEAFGLDAGKPKTPVLAMISRLADQKGFDLVAQVLPPLMARDDVMVVILGTGDERYHRWLEAEAAKYPGKLGAKIAFNNQLAHLMEAGADMFLMPSRYEPCGLNQIYSMKYGTIVVGRATGGLKDTIIPVNPKTGEGTGFLFEEYAAEDFLKALHTALAQYENQKLWTKIMQNAMSQDFSWKVSAKAYLDLYKRL